jgi:hypothetical protein
MKWDMYEQNLLAEYHIRYGGYGGIGYERNRFESSQATHLNRAVGLYFGLLV